MKKTISIDLDGVLNTYDGHFEEDKIPPMRYGAFEFLSEMSKNYKIEIFTTRSQKTTFLWLEKEGLIDFVSDITNVKNPYSSVFIDDRALQFRGDFPAVKE